MVAIILLVNLATLMVYSENGTHVIVNEYRQYGKMHHLKVEIKLTLNIFKNNLEDLEDFYVLVDSSSLLH